MSDRASESPPAIKDEDAEHPIAGAWRPMLREVVRSFVEGDYGLNKGVSGVEPVSPATAEHIRAYVADYGATLVELPDDTWQTSVAQWMGTRWDILVDLWTAEEGRSDLVLEGWVADETVLDGSKKIVNLLKPICFSNRDYARLTIQGDQLVSSFKPFSQHPAAFSEKGMGRGCRDGFVPSVINSPICVGERSSLLVTRRAWVRPFAR